MLKRVLGLYTKRLRSSLIQLFPFTQKHNVSSMKSAYTILADDSAIEKSLLDDRSYRFFKLESNNLHVLVINDPTTDRAAASLDVNVGSFADKKYTVPGLAHFCEHLLFMGTAKYPEENEYSSYLSKHSGHSNAYTAAEHTNYYFEVSSDYLEGALDRFAQFFISPLFSKSCKDREIKAVDSENKKNLQNDLWRMYQLDKLTSNPEHPYNGFSTGNYHTLHEEPISRGLNVRDVLLEFYKNQYSSNIMGLVVLGKESLDDLTEWSITKFSDIPNTNLPRPSYNGKLIYNAADLGKLTKAKPIMDTHKLELSFIIPDDQERNWECKPSGYFSHLLGHESKGSILHYLKKKNWVNELSAGGMKVCQGNSLFMVELELTPQGLSKWQDIVVHVFEYLSMLNSQEPQEWLWKEISDMSKINFRYKQKQGTSSTVSKISNKLYQFTEDSYIPPENLLNSSVVRNFNPVEIKKYGSYFNPDNFRLSLTSQDLTDLTEKEYWYGTEYSYEDIPFDLLKRVKSAGNNEGLHLPSPNKFIPQDFTVKGEKADRALGHPYLIYNSSKFETWFKQDDQFRVPKGHINLTIHAPTLSKSISTVVMGSLLSEMIDDELNEIKYYASIGGLSLHILQFRDGFSLKVGGYNDKLPEFLRQILEVFTAFKPKPDRFESIKFKVAQELKNFGYEIPYSQIGTHFLQLINELTYTDTDKFKVINSITFEDITKFAENLWSEGTFVQSLVLGNFDHSNAVEVDRLIRDSFKKHKEINSAEEKVREAIAFQSFLLEVGEHARYELPLQDANNVNSCLEYFIQVGRLDAENNRLRILTDLLATTIHEPCFNQLRTKEQLGYVVFSGYRLSRSYFGLRFLVQSERTCDYLEFRVEEFLKKFKNKNLGEELTEEAFAKFKQSLKNKKLTKLKNLNEESSRFWNAINDGYYDFTQKAKDAEELDSITREEFLTFFNDYFDVDNATKSSKLSVYLKSQKTPEVDESKLFASAIQNYIYKHDVPINSEVVDSILESKGSDLTAVIDEIIDRIQNGEEKIENLEEFKKNFVAEVSERTKQSTPSAFPKGTLYTLSDKFKDDHAKGGIPQPVDPLPSFYYPKGEARL